MKVIAFALLMVVSSVAAAGGVTYITSQVGTGSVTTGSDGSVTITNGGTSSTFR